MNNFFVDQLIETRSVKRLDRFALKVICLVLFVGLFVCLFVFLEFFVFHVLVLNVCSCPTTKK